MTKRLSDKYYARFQAWMSAMRERSENPDTPVSTTVELANEGFSFIWGDGSDVYDETEDEEGRVDDNIAFLDGKDGPYL